MKIEKLGMLIGSHPSEIDINIIQNKINQIIDELYVCKDYKINKMQQEINDLQFKYNNLSMLLAHHADDIVKLDSHVKNLNIAAKNIVKNLDEKDEIEILGCPFCGVKPYTGGGEQNTMIFCDNSDCDFDVNFLKEGLSKNEVIKAWNKRA